MDNDVLAYRVSHLREEKLCQEQKEKTNQE